MSKRSCSCGFKWDDQMTSPVQNCGVINSSTVIPVTHNTHNFDKIVEETCSQTKEVLIKKGKEYARENRYSNFEKVGRRHAISPEQALWYLRDKHEASIDDMIKDLEKDKLPTKELIDEKIGDDINYLLLLKGMLYRRIDL